MKYVPPIAGMVCTVFITLLMLVFMVAGMANASDEQLNSMELWATVLSLLSLACIVGSIVLLRKRRFAPATLVAFVPVAVMLVIFVVTAV